MDDEANAVDVEPLAAAARDDRRIGRSILVMSLIDVIYFPTVDAGWTRGSFVMGSEWDD